MSLHEQRLNRAFGDVPATMESRLKLATEGAPTNPVTIPLTLEHLDEFHREWIENDYGDYRRAFVTLEPMTLNEWLATQRTAYLQSHGVLPWMLENES